MDGCRLILKPKEEVRIRNGHAWVYGNEVARIEGEIVSGELANVYSAKGDFIGKGYLNTASKILVRILARDDVAIDRAFFKERLRAADAARRELGFTGSYRAFFAESDGIPGLIVDKYEDWLVVQVLSLGIEKRKAMFVELLVELFAPQGIYERSDVAVRIKEGLEEAKGVLYGTVPDLVRVEENGVLMDVDVKNGQKTGSFLDQRENHAAIAPYVRGKDVLDCFSHTGGFGLAAAKAGAKSVVCVDISASACDRIEKNAALNGFANVSVIKADVFSLLREEFAKGNQYDVVVLDPPAFTKNVENLANAYAGYKEINIQGLRLVRHGGYLVSCSCSHYMTPALFLEMLLEAGVDAGRIVQMIEFRTQGKDHPTLLGSEESFYLKVVVLRVLDRR
ncbi:MAG: class I SAM-dependent rRNA methyltransferase [Candidatus Izemoplasmatales bacterium]